MLIFTRPYTVDSSARLAQADMHASHEYFRPQRPSAGQKPCHPGRFTTKRRQQQVSSQLSPPVRSSSHCCKIWSFLGRAAAHGHPSARRPGVNGSVDRSLIMLAGGSLLHRGPLLNLLVIQRHLHYGDLRRGKSTQEHNDYYWDGRARAPSCQLLVP